ncbi:porin [Pedobacter sp. MW01-1-1]|uniref:porin n=1 Tax=Pedobacter sp. MW01-1-1 TaxID=3383027 RepID=UPI003FEF9E21
MKKILLAMLGMASTTCVLAQSTPSPLELSGSVDTYYKYDFAKQAGNISDVTSFASDHNSVSLGMIDIALKKKTGKASFVGEISFGPRGQSQSIPDAAANGSSFNIQNLYVNYDFTDKFSMTAGYMGTFVGYEVISPVGNFNYSTSYLFYNGPFQNAGIKATYKFSDKVSLMAGLFNDWNLYTATRGVSSIGAQLMVAPVEGWTAYLNVLSGAGAGGYGTVLDLTTAYQITKAFKLGLNAADYDLKDDAGGYTGVALYPQVAFSEAVSLGLRAEYFKYKDVGIVKGPEVLDFTLSANIKSGGLTFIPEVRLDHNSDGGFGFVNKNGTFAPNAGQFSLAAVYAF